MKTKRLFDTVSYDSPEAFQPLKPATGNALSATKVDVRIHGLEICAPCETLRAWAGAVWQMDADRHTEHTSPFWMGLDGSEVFQAIQWGRLYWKFEPAVEVKAGRPFRVLVSVVPSAVSMLPKADAAIKIVLLVE